MNNYFNTYIRKCIVMLLTLPLGGVGGVLLSSCSDSDSLFGEQSQSGNVINIGGIDTGDEITVSAEVTRSTEATQSGDLLGAENQSWLIQPLKKGLDITYGLVTDDADKKNERVAILKLKGPADGNSFYVSAGNFAEYSFNYRSNDGNETSDPAMWNDNGAHYFEGVHVPNRLRFNGDVNQLVTELETDNRTINNETVAATKNLASDQHDGTETGTDNQLGNYTLLTHYLGMPASTKIAATVSRIKLPFKHRLARVLVYVLIDPALGSDVKLAGYTATTRDESGNPPKDENGKIQWAEDPTTTSIRFNNVEVLSGVHDVYNQEKKLHTLTPIWKKERKVIPHFNGEEGTRNSEGSLANENFIMYTNIETKENIYGTSTKWASINTTYTNAYDAAKNNLPEYTEAQLTEEAEKTGYRQTNFGKVPLYDLVVRPTYTNKDNIMYDEGTLTEQQKNDLVSHTNSIDFEIKLNNNLEYEKTFEFDLNPNYQTAVYLLISREHVNYDSSGAEQWVARKDYDNWYGLDNKNGNTLSIAGSSWQRAFYNEKINYATNDITDGHYYQEDTEGLGQYVTPANWKKLFAEAYQGGKHHGDYFILSQDITIDASELPKDFVFTGHLDGRDHTITFTGGSSDVYEVTTNYGQYPTTDLYEKNVTGYSKYTLPDLYICEEVAQAKGEIPAGEGKMTKVTTTLKEVMSNNVEYYIKNADNSYSLFVRPTTLYTHRIGASSLFCGINGEYTTNQESANPEKDANGNVIWEANVHKETNKSTVWVPTTGYRAEVLNTKVVTGTMFPSTGTYTNTGYVHNCYDPNGIVNTGYTPPLPQYK